MLFPFFFFSCWLKPRPALISCIAPGGAILLLDLIILCTLHVFINRKVPEEHSSKHTTDSETDDKRNSANQSTNNEPVIELGFPNRKELLNTLKASLLTALLFILAFAFIIMVHTYRNSKSRYLYFFFSYATTCTLATLGLSLFYYHCVQSNKLSFCARLAFKPRRIKRHREQYDVQDDAGLLLTRCDQTDASAPNSPVVELKHIERVELTDGPTDIHASDNESSASVIPFSSANIFSKSNLDTITSIDDNSEESSQLITLRAENGQAFDGRGHSHEHITEQNGRVNEPENWNYSVVGPTASTSFVSKPAITRQISKSSGGSSSVNTPNRTFENEENGKPVAPRPTRSSQGSSGEKTDKEAKDMRRPRHLKKNSREIPRHQRITSDNSESDRHSASNFNRQNSVGAGGGGSFTSTSKKERPVNPNIPENLKSFVPETWRPVRSSRRNTAGVSYYPILLNADISKGNVPHSTAPTSIAVSNHQALFKHVRTHSGSEGPVSSIVEPSSPKVMPPPYSTIANANKNTTPPKGPVPYAPPNAMPQMIPNNVGMNIASNMRPRIPAGPPPHVVPPPQLPPHFFGPRMFQFGNGIRFTNPYVTVSGNLIQQTPKIDEDVSDVISSDEEVEPLAKVAPVVYIPMPHVTKKQFELRSETSV